MVVQVCESMYAPSSLFMVLGLRFLISIDSLIQRWYLLFSCCMTFALSQSMMWFSLLQWSVMADLRFSCVALSFIALVCLCSVSFSHSFLCSFFLMLNVLPVSPIYDLLHDRHGISYMTLHLLLGVCKIIVASMHRDTYSHDTMHRFMTRYRDTYFLNILHGFMTIDYLITIKFDLPRVILFSRE